MFKSYLSYLYNDTAKNSTRAVYNLLEKNKNAVLLDCGCWDGTDTIRAGNIIGTKNLYGIEVSREKAKEASKKGVKAKISDLNKKFQYNDNFFDVVVASHVIEHLVEVKLFVKEIYRVLKKNGYLVIGTPNLASWHNVFALLLGYQPFSGPTIKPDYESDLKTIRSLNKERLNKIFSGDKSSKLDHIKIMTTRALIGLLKDFKFKINNVNGFGYYPMPPVIAKLLSKIDPYHSHYIVVKARK